jgi:ABC-type glycerol-3-phosphate transport system permease component
MTGRRWPAALGIAAAVAAFALPLVWIAIASLSDERALVAGGPETGGGFTTTHYRAVFTERDFWAPIRSSLIVAATTTAACVVVGTACAYALARLRFRGKTPILAFVLAVSMFPQITIVSPLYLVLRHLGLIDTYPGLVLPYLTFALPVAIWLLVGVFRQLPAELEEAAFVDGAGRLRTLVTIVLPLAAPAIATTAIITFIYCWNEFLFALSFTVSPERRTAPVAIALFRGQYQVPWGQILAATMVTTLPIAVVVLGFQRRIVRGLTAGAVKG